MPFLLILRLEKQFHNYQNRHSQTICSLKVIKISMMKLFEKDKIHISINFIIIKTVATINQYYGIDSDKRQRSNLCQVLWEHF